MSEPRESRPWLVSVEPPHNPSKQAPIVAHAVEAARPPDMEKVAVLIAHGMGQQVPFETLELVARAIRNGEIEDRKDDPPVKTRMVMLEDKEFPRSEILVTTGRGKSRVVHLYEAYWAPLTEGKVTAREAAAFLIESGLNGIIYSTPWRKFTRWMFGREIELEFDSAVLLQFLGVLLVLLSVMLIFLVTIPALVSNVVRGGVAGLLQSPMLRHASAEAATVLVVTIAGVVALSLPKILRRLRPTRSRDEHVDTPARRRERRTQRPTAWPVMAIAWGGVVIILGILVLAAVDIVGHVLFPGLAHKTPMEWFFLTGWIERALPEKGWGWWSWMVVVWSALIWASNRLRGFLVQYVGDLAAYISSHKVSKFADVRSAIHRTTESVFEAVYKLRDAGAVRHEYSRVVVVGHSLGSVISYDALNALMLRDQLMGLGLDVARRTTLFLTFGSPLDKTAFIFRTQGEREATVREALAAAKQPMILSYESRPRRWVNLWSPNDWISGSLEYYDDPKVSKSKRGRVRNVKDPEASTPLGAHSEYWKTSAFRRLLRHAVAR